MFASVQSAVVTGIDGHKVTVEVYVSNGLPGTTIVGLPDAACREARDRVRAAVLAAKLPWPDRKVTVNLAPSSTRKVGTGLDLAIAIGILVAAEAIPPEPVAGVGFVGELGLDGTVRPVPAVIPLIDAIDAERVVVPVASVRDAELIEGPEIRGVRTLDELVAALKGDAPWPDHDPPPVLRPPPPTIDLADVRGQPVMRRAMEVAAAGGHHLLMVGTPGAGKTMLAERLPWLLPALGRDEAMEVSRIYSAAGRSLGGGLVRRPPFQAPHHSATLVSLVGGGTAAMRPGVVSLAHCGVLFLDELSEFAPSALDALRQPIEEGAIHVNRARFSAVLPARFLLVAAMNPCPCGEAGRPGACRCTEAALARYRRRLSGPLLDRFDLRVDVARPEAADLLGGEPGESTAVVGARVAAARRRAAARGVTANARLTGADLDRWAPLTDEAHALLVKAIEAGRLTARGLDRIRRVGLTIADLAQRDGPLGVATVSAALQLRADVALSPGVVAR